MDTNKLKIKIGEHEFEAEGPTDVVQSQFAAFKELIASLPATKTKAAKAETETREEEEAAPQPLALDKVMKSDGRVVSLTARGETAEEAVLLILLGQREYRKNESVTGGEILDGLKQSGYNLPRIDRLLDKLSSDGSVITVGVGRARRYRLSNQGLVKSQGIAKEVIATVP